jgi:dCMP deaminase
VLNNVTELTTAKDRPSWDDYLLAIAQVTAARSTCSRRKVGAVIATRDRRIVATGYNGGPRHYKHCLDGGCPRGRQGTDEGTGFGYESPEAFCIAIHAEANAIMFSSPEEREGASLYCTLAPCFGCAKLIANSGLAEVVIQDDYGLFGPVREFLLSADVRVRVLGG